MNHVLKADAYHHTRIRSRTVFDYLCHLRLLSVRGIAHHLDVPGRDFHATVRKENSRSCGGASIFAEISNCDQDALRMNKHLEGCSYSFSGQGYFTAV